VEESAMVRRSKYLGPNEHTVSQEISTTPEPPAPPVGGFFYVCTRMGRSAALGSERFSGFDCD